MRGNVRGDGHTPAEYFVLSRPRAPIKVGDLLVTSKAEGVAMKSLEVDSGGVKMHCLYTIIGKALEPLASGIGEILVQLSLQYEVDNKVTPLRSQT